MVASASSIVDSSFEVAATALTSICESSKLIYHLSSCVIEVHFSLIIFHVVKLKSIFLSTCFSTISEY